MPKIQLTDKQKYSMYANIELKNMLKSEHLRTDILAILDGKNDEIREKQLESMQKNKDFSKFLDLLTMVLDGKNSI